MIVLLMCITNFAQTSNDIPQSFNNNISTKVPVVEIENREVRLVDHDQKLPIQAGYTLLIGSDKLEAGSWSVYEDIYYWRLELYVPNARALNLYLQTEKMSESDRIYIYNPERDRVFNLTKGTTCSDFILGDRIIIEFDTEKKYKTIPIKIEEIGVRITPNIDLSKGFGGAGDCEVHVNCVEGEYWQNEKKGVARILVKQDNLTFWCTGSLINNTRNDGTPLFLTANHCGEYADSIDYSKWLFYFNFESENCTQPVFEPESNTISGSKLLSKSQSGTNNGSDFKLLLLDENLPAEYKPYYNGWDRKGITSPSGVTIHHPQGDVKMISTYTQSLISTRYDNTNEDPEGMYWQVYWSETLSGHGVTEGGSSGSPLFNNDGYIIGSLTGGVASCSFLNKPDYYGKLSYSWESNKSDSTSNLSYWLDPMQTGITTLKGTNLDSTNVFAGFSGEPKSIIVGQSVSFINTSFGNISGYTWYFEGGSPEYSELKEPGKIIYNNAGEFDVKLIVSSSNGTDTLIAKDYIKVLPNISPNPTKRKVKIAFGGAIPKDYSIRVFNSMGKETEYSIDTIENNYLIIDLFPNKKGTYLIKLTSTQINNTYKVIVIGD